MALNISGNTSADIDECAMGNVNCSHNCSNTAGSYQCLCDPGYSLMEDNMTCEGMLVNEVLPSFTHL